MAVVFLAEDLKHHHRVALKVMKPDVGTSLGSETFLREIDIAAKLSGATALGIGTGRPRRDGLSEGRIPSRFWRPTLDSS